MRRAQVGANHVANTVALAPGDFDATVAQFNDLTGQGRRLKLLIPAAVLGRTRYESSEGRREPPLSSSFVAPGHGA